MKREDSLLDDTLPIQLKIRVLEAELEQVVSDLERLEQLQRQILDEIDHYQTLLAKKKRAHLLYRVK